MKKLFTIVTLLSILSTSAFAVTLDEKISKIETRYEKRIEQIDNMKRVSSTRKDMLKRHAKQDADLRIAQTKELETLKTSR